MRISTIRIVLVVFLLFANNGFTQNTPSLDYQKWLKDLKQEMKDRGISQSTIKKAFSQNYYYQNHNVIKQDRKQNECILSTSDYLKRVISKHRVDKGRIIYKTLIKQYPNGINGVPLHYLVAFWGIETNFGENKGGYNAIEALTILSYDTRRAKFFREEL